MKKRKQKISLLKQKALEEKARKLYERIKAEGREVTTFDLMNLLNINRQKVKQVLKKVEKETGKSYPLVRLTEIKNIGLIELKKDFRLGRREIDVYVEYKRMVLKNKKLPAPQEIADALNTSKAAVNNALKRTRKITGLRLPTSRESHYKGRTIKVIEMGKEKEVYLAPGEGNVFDKYMEAGGKIGKRDIANKLGISERSVGISLSHLRKKTGMPFNIIQRKRGWPKGRVKGPRKVSKKVSRKIPEKVSEIKVSPPAPKKREYYEYYNFISKILDTVPVKKLRLVKTREALIDTLTPYVKMAGRREIRDEEREAVEEFVNANKKSLFKKGILKV